MKILFSIFLVLSLISCTKKQLSSDNTLRVVLTDGISSLDPALSYDTVSGAVVYQLYEQLYQYNYLKRPYTLEPLLAESMPIIKNNGKQYIIKLKKGVQYHDHPAFKGKKRYLKAEDFVTQIKRLAYLPTRSGGWWLFNGKVKGLNRFRKRAGNDFSKFKSLKVEGLTTPDDYTLVIDLVRPYPQLKYALAMSFTSPVPEEVVEYEKNNLRAVVVGTGPFELVKWDKLNKVIAKKNPNFRDEKYPTTGDRISHSSGLLSDAGKRIPFIDSIEFNIMKESSTQWLNFVSGKLDFLVVPKDNYATAVDVNGNISKELKSRDISVQMAPTLTYWWLAFNMKDPIVGKNLNLRKAIAHAIDVDEYIKLFTNNIGLKANSIYPPGVPGYDPTTERKYNFNLDLAKEYLAKAGYPNGKGLPKIVFDLRGNSSTERQRAEFVKRSLKKIGMNISTELNTFPAFLQKLKEGNLQFWLGGWAMDYPDAENSLQLLSSKNHPPAPNSTYYSNPKFDKLFNKLIYMQDGDEKFKLMKKLEDIVQEDLNWALLYYKRDYIASQKRLQNYRHSDVINNYFKYLKLK